MCKLFCLYCFVINNAAGQISRFVWLSSVEQ